MKPSVFLALANLRRPRREGYDAEPDELVSIGELPSEDLDRLACVASRLADAIVARQLPLPVAELNGLARGAESFAQLVADAGAVAVRLERTSGSCDPVADLAAQIAAELASADLERVKGCTRPECSLVFYDATRSRTQRWHAEAPCGRLQRQRRHRAGRKRSPDPDRPS